MAALEQLAVSGGDVANFTTIIVQEGVLPGEALYVCPDCGRSFLYEEQCALRQQSHLQVSPDCGDSPAGHPQPEVRAYTCLDCGRWFPHQARPRKHCLWHTGDRPHTCAECKKTFRLKINLHLHECTHTVAKKNQLLHLQPMRLDFQPPLQFVTAPDNPHRGAAVHLWGVREDVHL